MRLTMTRRQRRYFTVWGVIAACLIVSVLWMFLLHLVATGWQNQCVKAYSDGYECGKSEVEEVVVEESIHYMPLFLQKDMKWYGKEYADGCIGTHGCGLIAAAMALSYISGEIVTPDNLASLSGDEFITDGVNDPDKICNWLSDNYNLLYSGEVWTLEDGLKLVNEGYCVLASMSGKLGERVYDSHVVLIYGMYGMDYLIRDPDDGDNSIRSFSEEELRETTWISFNGIK